MKRRSFLKGVLGVVAATQVPMVKAGEISPNLKSHMGIDWAKAHSDMAIYGVGVLRDGKHVPLGELFHRETGEETTYEEVLGRAWLKAPKP